MTYDKFLTISKGYTDVQFLKLIHEIEEEEYGCFLERVDLKKKIVLQYMVYAKCNACDENKFLELKDVIGKTLNTYVNIVVSELDKISSDICDNACNLYSACNLFTNEEFQELLKEKRSK